MDFNHFVAEILIKDAKTEIDKAVYLCFYYESCKNIESHTITEVIQYFKNAGLTKPNSSRLMSHIKSSRSFVKDSKRFKLHIKVKTDLSERYKEKLTNIRLETNNEVLDEKSFLQFSNLYPMVIEMNAAYKYGIYDGCEVLMRRIFENLLIMVYENFNLAETIKVNGIYKNLSEIIKDAEKNKIINLSRSKNNYKKFVEEFNTSAHNRYYLATKQAIDELKHKYQVSIAELIYKTREGVEKNG